MIYIVVADENTDGPTIRLVQAFGLENDAEGFVQGANVLVEGIQTTADLGNTTYTAAMETFDPKFNQEHHVGYRIQPVAFSPDQEMVEAAAKAMNDFYNAKYTNDIVIDFDELAAVAMASVAA